MREAENDEGLLLNEGVGTEGVRTGRRQVSQVHGKRHNFQGVCQLRVFHDIVDVLACCPQELDIVY